MAISDQSYYNTYIARSLVDTSKKSVTGNTMPESVEKEIRERVEADRIANNGKIPSSTYKEVARIMSPYVPGMSVNALAGLLRVNNLLGTDQQGLQINGSIEKHRKNFNKKQSEVATRTVKNFSSAETGGFLTDAANKLTSAPRGVAPVMSRSAFELDGPPPYEIGKNEVKATGKFVSSVEELEYDMGSADRKISEIIVHTSETFSNANLTGKQLQDLTGSGSNSYHYIIKRDGSVERGVPIKQAGKHCPGHDQYSIGVCLIGGVSAATEGQGLIERKDPSSITRSQYNTLYQIFRVFFTQYPGGQALGHGETDESKDDPGFEVRDYVYNLFNKQSLYTDQNDMKSGKSPDEILAAIDGEGPNVLDKDTEVLDKKF